MKSSVAKVAKHHNNNNKLEVQYVVVLVLALELESKIEFYLPVSGETTTTKKYTAVVIVHLPVFQLMTPLSWLIS